MHITFSPLSLSIYYISFYVTPRPISLPCSGSSRSSSSSSSSFVSRSSFGAESTLVGRRPRGTKKRRERNRGGGEGFFLSLPRSAFESSAATMSAFIEQQDPRIKAIKTKIRVVPNFPKPGIMFQDITTLLLDHKAFKDTIDLFVERYKGKNISIVAGIEARGFIFGPPIALAIGAKFVPLRKPKKLPGEVISEEYILEYGRDCLEMHVGAVEHGERALVVDDLIATGGTLCAAMNLLERVGAEVVECACVIELPDLKGRDRLKDKPLYVLVESH